MNPNLTIIHFCSGQMDKMRNYLAEEDEGKNNDMGTMQTLATYINFVEYPLFHIRRSMDSIR